MSVNLESALIASQAEEEKIIVDCCLVRGCFLVWCLFFFTKYKVEQHSGSNMENKKSVRGFFFICLGVLSISTSELFPLF